MIMKNEESYPRIREIYSNKTIFITGASGFIGKVLIEKLLRSCPDLKRIYVLLRPKRGLKSEERLTEILSEPLFEKLNETNTEWQSKLTIVSGDVAEINLGLSEFDRNLVVNKANFFFHIAASVRFDDSLQNAIIINTRGTREACNLALEMKNIELFFHVSTTYCNLHKEAVKEELYPPIADWKQAIQIAETMDAHDLQIISHKILGLFPNTYTFTKNLSEHVVGDLCDGKIPAIIVRPSIVVSTVSDPFPGWIDNFNGPPALLIVAGKGISRVNLGDENIRLDYVPVDYVVKAIIILTYYRITRENERTIKKLQVVNASADLRYAVTTRQTLNYGRKIVDKVPFKNPLWYPGGDITSSKLYYFIQIFFVQLLPAIFVDAILKLTGHKPILLKIQKKIFVANTALQYFINKEWPFINTMAMKVRTEINKSDYEDFYVDVDPDQLEYFTNATIGAKKYLLKEDMDDLNKDKDRIFQMKILHYALKTIFIIVFTYLTFSYLYSTIPCVISCFGSYYNKLMV